MAAFDKQGTRPQIQNHSLALMAGDWIKMRCNLDTDPAVFQIAAALEMDELAVVGRLWRVWAWADQHCADCNAVSVTRNVLDRITSTPGFADAMQKVGWLEGLDGALSFPHFDRHNGQTAKKRALTKNRVEKTRTDSVTLPALQKRYQRREEKSSSITVAAGGFDLEQVIEAGRRAMIPEDVCRAYHDDREGAGWLDGKGRRVSSMPHDLSGFWRKWQSNRSPKQFGNGSVNGHNGSPKPAEGVWHLEKRMEAARREIDRIQANPDNKMQVADSFDRVLKPEHMAKVKALKASISAMRQQMVGVEAVA
jgi:hypothetical protein